MHWKALSATATLEEEIEKLHQMRGHFQLEVRPKRRDHQRLEGMWKQRCCQVSFASKPTTSQSVDPDTPPGEMESEDRASNLGEPPELKLEVASFWKDHQKHQMARVRKGHRSHLCQSLLIG